MRRSLRVAALLATLALADAAPILAQATGTIAGVVTDESGAVIPGVSIEATNTATNQTRTVVSDESGFYTAPLLPPVPYTVKATLQGFRTMNRQGVTVMVESTSRVDFRMAVGGIVETITIDALPPLVETSHAQLGLVVEHEKIVDLPLNGRNFTQLGMICPEW